VRRVIHLLPYDGIGGAEEAARSMADASSDELDFKLRFLFPKVRSSRQRLRTWNPLALLRAVRGILRDKPDLLIVSLWRSCIAGILVRLLRPRTRMVVLIHNSVDAHWLDHLFTRWAMALSCAIWADSNASMQLRFPGKPRAGVSIIPFLTRTLSPSQGLDTAISPSPDFVFWGRLAAQKNLTRAIGLFHRIWQARPEARFTVIGPDAGQLATLQTSCLALGLDQAVRFAGAMEFAGIQALAGEHAFYLQTSSYEGMAMSIVEAMQLGLVPVVTPVGEVGAYCRNEENAVLVQSDEQAAASVLRIIDDPAAYMELRRRAILTWQGKPLYRDAVLAESLRLIGQ
jgi:glycosyltransferase involved in cell wall biosynthesis